MSQDTIDDPLKLIDFCNKNIKEIESEIADARSRKDFDSTKGLSNQMLRFTELLEKAIHQAYQQGKTKQDVSKMFEPDKKKDGKRRYKG